MQISTVNKAIRIYKKIWSVVIIVLSLAFLVYALQVYFSKPVIVDQIILSNKNIYKLATGDKVSFGDRVWNVNYVFSENDKNYYSITLTN